MYGGSRRRRKVLKTYTENELREAVSLALDKIDPIVSYDEWASDFDFSLKQQGELPLKRMSENPQIKDRLRNINYPETEEQIYVGHISSAIKNLKKMESEVGGILESCQKYQHIHPYFGKNLHKLKKRLEEIEYRIKKAELIKEKLEREFSK